MKIHTLGILFAVLALCHSPAARAEETILIDADHGNGGFETGDLTGWMETSDLLSAVKEIPATPRNGSQVFHVKIMGKPGERATKMLFQNVTKVDPGNGRTFVVKFDKKAIPDHLAPDVTAEIVLFSGDEVVQTVVFGRNENLTDSTEWESFEMNAAEPVSADWAGGKIQLRLVFFKDSGEEGESYQTLVDNVRLIQRP
jgi:hypothetical protein